MVFGVGTGTTKYLLTKLNREPPNMGHFGDSINLTDLFFIERFSSLVGLIVL